MLFNSFQFIGFFLIVLVAIFLVSAIRKTVAVRNCTLLLASYAFYASFNVGFLLVLIYVTLITYYSGYKIYNCKETQIRKRWVAIGVVFSLLPLIFFKYSLFLFSSLRSLLSIEISIEVLEGLLLPIGISFYTFQALSYVIDIYRKYIDRPANIIDYSLFVSFFPTVLSGPIEKAHQLLPQIQRYFLPNNYDILQGACIFIWGLFKKIVIADRLAAYVDWAYGSAAYQSGATLALAAVFYSIQIYCDFSGYSDMALGIAKALGFDLIKNFRQPYFSKTIKEFWRKWHIALTSWFTEYVYFSLGGSRVKLKLRWVFNISMVFILSGIWHGTAWNFLIWGCLHALYYLIEHFAGLQKKDLKWTRFAAILSGIWVFILVTFAWIFFRVPTFNHAIFIIGKIFSDIFSPLSLGSSSFTFACNICLLAVFLLFELSIRKKWLSYDVVEFKPVLVHNIWSLLPLLIIISLFAFSSDSFVYFQF